MHPAQASPEGSQVGRSARPPPFAACDAAKIRWRNRRTLSSQARQSTARHSRITSSGPFTTTLVVASNLSFGSGVTSSSSSQAHLIASARFRVRALASRIRPVIRDDRLKEPTIMSRFPAVFRPPAFACRSSDSHRGIGPSLRSAYRPTTGPRRGLPRSARTSCDRGGCLLYPEDGGALPAECTPQPSPAASQRLVLVPRYSIPPTGLPMTRHQRRFTQFTRPVVPSPVTPGWNGSP